MLCQALCIILYPSVNWHRSHSPEMPNSVQNWLFLSSVTLKFDGWPWKTIGHLFYVTWSFVHHFLASGEFKPELQSGNTQFGSKLVIFLFRGTLKFLRMTSKHNRVHLLCHCKLGASFHNHLWTQTGITVRKHPKWDKIYFDFCDLDLLPVTLTFGMDITFVNGNNSWKFHDDTMTGTLWKRCDWQMDRRTERNVLRDTWSQLKNISGEIIVFYFTPVKQLWRNWKN